MGRAAGRAAPLAARSVARGICKHIVEAWNAAPNRKPADQLEEQTVVLTVPASFDDVARNLTVEAAKQAGLKHVTLLEEPQAAFYSWLGTHSAAGSRDAQAGDALPRRRRRRRHAATSA